MPRTLALQVLAELAGVSPETLHSDQELVADLGIDSPRALLLIAELEDRLEIEIQDEDLVQLHTVGDVLAAVDRRAEG
jgi:acyl carrier protein